MAAYQPIQMPGGSGDFGDVFDLIQRARQASQQAEMQRAELLLKQQGQTQQQQLQAAQIQNYQSEAAQRAAAEADRRSTMDRQQHVDIATAIPKIRDMLTPGHAGYDPEAGMSLARAYGINLAAKAPEMPQAPTLRPIGPTQVEYGPRISPEDAQQSAVLSAKTSPDQPDARADEVTDLAGQAETERQRFAQANDPAAVARNTQEQATQDAEQGNYVSKVVEASKRAPTYSGTSPVGPVSIDPNAIIAAREAERKRQQDQLSPLANIPGAEKYKPVVEAMVAAGMPGSEVAKFLQEATKEAHADKQKSEYSLTAEDQRRHQLETERIGWAGVNSRAQGQANREGDALDNTIVRDERGRPIGRVSTGRGGAQGFSTRDADYSRGEGMLDALIADVKTHGARALTPEQVTRRQTLYKNAIIGVATVSPLGKTDEAQKLEAASIGASGAPDMHDPTGVVVGANMEALLRKKQELRDQRERYRQQTLIPLEENPIMNARHPKAPGNQPSKNETRAETIKNGGKAKSLDDLAKEAGL